MSKQILSTQLKEVHMNEELYQQYKNNELIVFGSDTETTPFQDADKNIPIQLRLWCLYHPYQTHKGFTTKSFVKQLKRIHLDYQTCIIIYYNLPFDAYQVFDNLTDEYRIETIALNTTPFFVLGSLYHKPEKKVLFLGLENFSLRGELDSLAKEFLKTEVKDLEGKKIALKEKLDKNDMKKLIAYCMQDSKLVYQLYELLFPFYHRYSQLKPYFSSAHWAWKEGLKISNWKPPYRSEWLKKIERLAYKGGRVYRKMEMVGKWFTGYKIDIHSSYPSVMYDYKVPVNYLTRVNSNKEKYSKNDCYLFLKEIFTSDNRTCLIQGKFLTYYPVLPVKDKDNKIDFPVGEVEGYFSIYEVYPALQKGFIEIIHIRNFYIYETMKGLFNEYITKYYTIKSTTHNPFEKHRSKIMLNSFYGGGGKRKIKYSLIQPSSKKEQLHDLPYTYEQIDFLLFVANTDTQKQGSINIAYNDKNIKINTFNDIYYIEEKLDIEDKGRATIMSLEVCAMGRWKLWDEIIFPNYDWCNYGDTDSGIPEKLVNPEILDPDRLGKWWFEFCCKEGKQEILDTYFPEGDIPYDFEFTMNDYKAEYRFFDRKDYDCKHQSKIKSVPKRAKLLQDEKGYYYGYKHVLRPKEASKRGLQPYSYIEVKKRPKTRIQHYSNDL